MTTSRHPVRHAIARGVWRVLRAGAVVAVAVALAPVTVVAAATAAFGWWRGRPARRLLLGAAGCVPMIVAWLVAVAVWPAGDDAGPVWFRVAAAPYHAWLAWWHLVPHGRVAAAVVAVAPAAIPLGILAGAFWWARRVFRMETGGAGRSPASAARFDDRLWRRQVRAARALAAAPAAIPLLTRGDAVVTGATIRAVRHRAGRTAAIPHARMRSHQVVIGSTGTGKTTLLLRLWAGFMAGGLRRYAAGAAGLPLLVVLDCKGGASSRKVADRTRRVLRDAGARSTAIWPDESALSLWSLPPDQLVTTLLDLIEHGTGGAAYYTDVLEALVSQAVGAPCGPPVSSADFLRRLDADWLGDAYGDRPSAATARAVEDAALRFRALWRRLGPGFDGHGSFGDADCWYCVLEGTAEQAVAEAQARALTDLLASFAVRDRREILLCVDEFSAVSRRLPIWRLYERARSLGMAVCVSAQSWEGLAETEDERLRVASTAEGGIWLMRTPRPEPVAALAGTRPGVDTSRRLTGAGQWEATGSSRAPRVPVADSDLVRRLDVGQVAYVYRGGITYVQVKRLVAAQAALAPGLASEVVAEPGSGVTACGVTAGGVTGGREARGVTDGREAGGASEVPGPTLPDASEVLDEAFGARRA